MKIIQFYFVDIVKCFKTALIISTFIFTVTIAIYLIKYHVININTLYILKNYLYYCGCSILFLAVGFFIQKRSYRPLEHQEEWNQLFKKLNLSLVIMFIGLFICSIGMIVQFTYESLLR
jgi:hypothetical protein